MMSQYLMLADDVPVHNVPEPEDTVPNGGTPVDRAPRSCDSRLTSVIIVREYKSMYLVQVGSRRGGYQGTGLT